MELSRNDARTVERVLAAWEADATLSRAEVVRLRDTIAVRPFDWQRLAKYAMWFAVACIATSIGFAFADEAIRRLLSALFGLPDLAKALLSALAAALVFRSALRRRERFPARRYSNEALFFIGVLFVAGTVACVGHMLDTGSGHYSLLFLAASLAYGALGVVFPSTLVWIFGVFSLSAWIGAETGYESGWGAYYLGMNYPLRFVAYSLVLLACSVWRRGERREGIPQATYVLGLLHLFVALWILSIFGNYDWDSWHHVSQSAVAAWSLLFGLASAGAIVYGLRHDDRVASGFGITFGLINVYTRFFEYGWDSIPRALFFALLGLSCWAVGRFAEDIWSLGGRLATD